MEYIGKRVIMMKIFIVLAALTIYAVLIFISLLVMAFFTAKEFPDD